MKTKSPPFAPAFDVQRIREDFPILKQRVYGKPLIYLDNAATSQKPKIVIDTLSRYHLSENANIHRGVHFLSQQATAAYEGARAKVQRFINAGDAREIIFVKSTTEAINLVAATFGRGLVSRGDEVLISHMEHHSNIVPWQMLCEEKGARLRVVPVSDAGEFLFEEYEKLLSPKTKLVAVAHISNALGSINPVKEIIETAHAQAIPVLLDGAQAAQHLPVAVQALDCDFYAFSGHKLYGPTGIGVLYGKAAHLEKMPPYQGGGDMILSVTFEKTIYNHLPHKFEAGTPNIAAAIGLAAAIDYLGEIGFEKIARYEDELLEYATKALLDVDGLRFIGRAKEKAAILTFLLDGVHPHDVGTILDREGVAIRTGHHCAQPLMERFGVAASCRASLAFYNTQEEIDALVLALGKVKRVFS